MFISDLLHVDRERHADDSPQQRFAANGCPLWPG